MLAHTAKIRVEEATSRRRDAGWDCQFPTPGLSILQAEESYSRCGFWPITPPKLPSDSLTPARLTVPAWEIDSPCRRDKSQTAAGKCCPGSFPRPTCSRPLQHVARPGTGKGLSTARIWDCQSCGRSSLMNGIDD